MPVQGRLNLLRHRFSQGGRSTQIASTLVAQSESQVAGSSLAVFDFSLGAQAKSLLCALMGLLLRHSWAAPYLVSSISSQMESRILESIVMRWKGD